MHKLHGENGLAERKGAKTRSKTMSEKSYKKTTLRLDARVLWGARQRALDERVTLRQLTEKALLAYLKTTKATKEARA